MGYLLKDRVADVSDFVKAITLVAGGGTVLDPEVVQQLLSANRAAPGVLTPREREISLARGRGRYDATIAAAAGISARGGGDTRGGHLAKLGLEPSGNDDPPGYRRPPVTWSS